jgi:alcohol dehydrogenase (NADP+)
MRGTSVIPKTVGEARMTENRAIFQLSDDDMTRIDSIATKKGVVRYLEPKDYLGFDIFNEKVDEPVGYPNNM